MIDTRYERGSAHEMSPRARYRRARYVTAAFAGAATVPYLVLKALWLSGSTVGVEDRAFLHDAGIESLNAFTAGMDLVALTLVLVFVTPIGRRVPGWLVLFPMWVGTGFLAPIGVGAPVLVVYSAVSGHGVTGHGAVQPWVYEVVYTGFVVEGVFLVATFVLYAADRWVWALRADGWAARPERPTAWLERLLGRAAAGLAALAGMIHLVWAAGVTSGLSARWVRADTVSTRLTEAIFGIVALAGAAGILILGRGRVAFVLAWAGTGALLAWGFWNTILTLGETSLGAGSTQGSGPMNLVWFAELLAGLLAGTMLAFTLAARGSGTIETCQTCGYHCAG
jgi:hypothetical protein